MKRVPFLTLVVLFSVFLVGLSAEEPVVLQPSAPSYTPAERAALLAGIDAVTGILGSGYPLSYRQLEGLGFKDDDFIEFTAGTLYSAGYRVAIVEKDGWNGSSHRFLLVGIDLGDDVFGWIPVEASPSELQSHWLLGEIPWADESETLFDFRYLSYDRLIEYVVITLPSLNLRPPGSPVINNPAATMVFVEGARIIAYQWSIDGGAPVTTTSSTLWHTFTEPGDHTISVTVIDEHGGRATAEVSFEVLEKRHQCHCNNP